MRVPTSPSDRRPSGATSRAQAARAASRGEAGFTLVEVMVAAMVLVVGVLGTLTMAVRASEATTTTKSREGATNLAREIVEQADSLRYGAVDPSTLASTLQAKPGLASAPGYGSWTVVRRGIAYGISLSVCYVDDPADGLGAHDATFCPGAAGGDDSQPVDLKRVTVRVTWNGNTGAGSVEQRGLVSPGGNSDVPTISAITSNPSNTTITDPAVTSIDFFATTSAIPSGVAWSINEGVRGLATGAGNTWRFTWNLSGVRDGTYTIGARAFNGSGTYGTEKPVTITINRNTAAAAGNFVAGYNGPLATVDTEWLASPDPDVIGYTVYRQQTAPTPGAVTKVNCGTAANPYVTTKTSCTDPSPVALPAAPAITYKGTDSANNNSGSVNLARPATVPGDVLVAVIASPTTGTIAPPSGWTRVADTLGAGFRQASFTRLVAGGEPSSYTFSVAGGSSIIGGLVAYGGVDNVAPVGTAAAASGSTGTAVSPSVTTTTRGATIVTPFSIANASALTLEPSLATRWSQSRAGVWSAQGDFAMTQAGASGTKTATSSTTNSGWVAQTIALRNANPFAGVAVNYWVVPLDTDPSTGNPREGALSNKVNAYAINRSPSPITSAVTCVKNADGSSTLSWTQPSQPGDPDTGDSIAFSRVYRDGARFDRTGQGTDATYTDPRPGGTHTYSLRTVDGHLAESTASASVTC